LNEFVVFTCLLPQHRLGMGFRPNSSCGRINRRGGPEEKKTETQGGEGGSPYETCKPFINS